MIMIMIMISAQIKTSTRCQTRPVSVCLICPVETVQIVKKLTKIYQAARDGHTELAIGYMSHSRAQASLCAAVKFEVCVCIYDRTCVLLEFRLMHVARKTFPTILMRGGHVHTIYTNGMAHLAVHSMACPPEVWHGASGHASPEHSANIQICQSTFLCTVPHCLFFQA